MLHDQEVNALPAADVEHGADVRVTQGGEGFCFALEPLLQFRIGSDVFGEDLNGDGAVQAGIGGLVDFAL
jgi:hypothetical protein